MKRLQCKQIIEGLPPILNSNHVMAMDLELSGLKDGQLHRPHGELLSLAGSFDGETAYIVFGDDEVQEFLDRVDQATWVFHNAVFDLAHLKRWAKIVERKAMRDTMLIERILFNNYYDDFGLNDLVRRYLGCYMPKDVRKEFSGHEGRMTPEQIKYAADDVIGTWLVDREQQKLVDPVSRKVWDNLYNPHVYTTLELGGFSLDKNSWIDLAEGYQEIADKIQLELGNKYGHTDTVSKGRGKNKTTEEVYVPLNLASPMQVLKVLQSFGLKVEKTDDDALRPFYDTNEFVNKLLDYRKAAKQASTYGMEFLKYVEGDDKIYTSLNIALADTGRDSSSSPNLQNIPRDTERRKCFIAAPGKKLVLYDYSGQEANIWAYLTGDEKFKEIINGGKKLYIEVARIAFGEDVKKGTERYNLIKSLVLGLMYGLTPHGFARDTGVDMETATDMFNKFFEGFPQSAKYVLRTQKRNNGYVETVVGRRCNLHPYNRQWKNNALNSPMQGCIAGDSLILSEHHGLLPIASLNSLKISVWDGHEFVNAKVAYSGKKQKYIVTLTNGSQVVCSPDHKFSTYNVAGSKIWRSAKELSKSHKGIWVEASDTVAKDFSFPVRRVPNRFIPRTGNAHTESVDGMSKFDLGVWAGRIASDGSVPKSESVTLIVAEHEKEILDYLVDLTSTIYPPRVRQVRKSPEYAPLYTITLDHKKLATWLTQEGIKTEIPRFAREDKECLRGYLRGMFDGDGTVNKDGAYLTFGKGGDFHYAWAKQISVALSLFGISARVNRCQSRINVRVLKRDMPIFCEEIGFINSKKQILAEAITSTNGWGGIYGRAFAIKSVEVTDEWIDMFDVVDSDTSQFMVNGVVTHNSGSDMIKLAMKRLRRTDFYKKYHPEGRIAIILQVHDEILCEVDADLAPEWDAIQKQVMIETAEMLHPGIKGAVSGGIIDNWSEKDKL